MSTLTWQADADWQLEDKVFGQVLLAALVLLLVLAVLVPLYQVPERSRAQLEQLPPQLARVMLPPREITPPEPIVLPEPEPVSEPEAEPEPEPVVAATPAAESEPARATAEPLASARAKAEQAGLMAMRDELAALRQTFTVQQHAPQLQPSTQSQQAATVPEQITDPRLAKTAAKAAASASTEVARQALANADTSKVATAELQGLASNAPSSTATSTNDSASNTPGGRSEASIRQILEANKSSLYTLYNRALRANPLLRGKVVFELVINPDGSLAQVRIVESELQDERLERQLQLRLQAVNFGAAQVSPTRSQWTIAFLPG